MINDIIFLLILLIILPTNTISLSATSKAEDTAAQKIHPLTGAKTRIKGSWIGFRKIPETTQIVVMAGHADSQGMTGAGTPGEAVDLLDKQPMDFRMRDELYWNKKGY